MHTFKGSNSFIFASFISGDLTKEQILSFKILPIGKVSKSKTNRVVSLDSVSVHFVSGIFFTVFLFPYI